jgi:hypothetical protein
MNVGVYLVGMHLPTGHGSLPDGPGAATGVGACDSVFDGPVHGNRISDWREAVEMVTRWSIL